MADLGARALRRRWTTLLAAVGAVLLVAWMARTLIEEDARRSVRRPASTEHIDQPQESESGVLRLGDGYVEVIERDDSETTAAETPARFWYGLVVDARTRHGEQDVAITIEGVDESRSWPAGQSLERGVFAVRVPAEVDDAAMLRLAFTAYDGRMALRAVPVPSGPSHNVGRVILRGIEKLRGRCLTRPGRPVSGVLLSLRAFGELHVRQQQVVTMKTDKHGYFDLPRAPRGMYVLEGRAPDGALYLEAPVTLPHDGVLVMYERPTSALAVIVRDSVGRAVEGAQVTATLGGANAEKDPLGWQHLLSPVSVTTDEHGRANVIGLPQGIYRVRVGVGTDGYDFAVGHSAVSQRPALLTIPVDGRVVVRCLTSDGEPNVRRSLLLATPVGPVQVVTDDDGLVRLDRGQPPSFVLRAHTTDGTLAGKLTLAHWNIVEGQVSVSLVLHRQKRPAVERRDPARRVERVATVRTRRGLPVRDARLLVAGSRTVRTDKRGYAELGKVGIGGRVRLERRDLASGHPKSGELGTEHLVEFIWNEGLDVTLEVTDAQFGFPVDDDVRIGINESAWVRLGQGRFRARWDPHSLDPADAMIVVRAPGYEPLELEPPRSDGPPVVLHARLVRPGYGETATLDLRVVRGRSSAVGARVRGYWLDKTPDVIGRAQFVALAAEGGRLVLRGLRPGNWSLRADAGFDGWGRERRQLAPGPQSLTLVLRHAPTHIGYVEDGSKRPVEGAVVTVVGPADQTPARTRRDGAFALNLARSPGSRFTVFATRAGYSPGLETWKWKLGRWDRPPIQLTPRAALRLPIKWRDKNAQTIPGDLRFVVTGAEASDGTPILATAYVKDDHLVVDGFPAGRIRIVQQAGSAYARPLEFIVKHPLPDQVPLDRPVIQLEAGVTVYGVVREQRASGARLLVSIRSTDGPPRTVFTDSKGSFVLHGVPPGDLSIEIDGQTAASRKRNLGVPGKNGERVDVAIDR